jgi:hypothetical protein
MCPDLEVMKLMTWKNQSAKTEKGPPKSLSMELEWGA